MINLYNKTKELFWGTTERIHPSLHTYLFRYRIYLKYLISGGTAAFVNLALLAFLVEVFGMYYLLASALAFIVAFITSFMLQKFFTFGDITTDRIHNQLSLYLLIALVNLGVNSGLMYLLVDIVGVWYFLSQAISSMLIAICSFIMYRRFVFNRRS